MWTRNYFLWGDQEGKRKDHLIRWEHVCLPVVAKGLGVRSIKEVNTVLISKWLWRLDNEGDSLGKLIFALCLSCQSTKPIEGGL